MANLMNRDFADKRFLRTMPRRLAPAAGDARERLSRVLLFAAVVFYGCALAASGIVHQRDGATTESSARVERG